MHIEKLQWWSLLLSFPGKKLGVGKGENQKHSWILKLNPFYDMFQLLQPFSYSAGVLLQVTTGELEVWKLASAVMVCVHGQQQQILGM